MVHLADLLERIPQARLVPAEVKARWLAGVLKHHSDRAEFHVKRLCGLGGSEMGALVRHANDLGGGGFTTAERIVQQKLLMRLPEFETTHMRRGNVLEPLARAAFMHRFKAQRDLDAISRMGQPHGRADVPWLVGNPDDIVMMQGRRLLPDYKVPNTFTDHIEFDYSAQLHHYALGAKLRGIQIDGLVLAKLDLSQATADELVEKLEGASLEEIDRVGRLIADADLPGFRVVGQVIDQSRAMYVDILATGKVFWEDYVLQGRVPQPVIKPPLPLSDEQLLAVGDLERRYAKLAAVKGRVEREQKEVGAQLAEACAGIETENFSMPHGLVIPKVTVTSKADEIIAAAYELGAEESDLIEQESKYNEKALLEEIKRLGGDINNEALFVRSVSAEKADAFLKSKGVSTDEYQTKSHSVRLSTRKDAKPVIDHFSFEADSLLGAWLENRSDAAGDLSDSLLEEPDSQASKPSFGMR